MTSKSLPHFARNLPKNITIPDDINQFWKEMDDLIDFVNNCQVEIDGLDVRVTQVESRLNGVEGNIANIQTDATTSESGTGTKITDINSKLAALTKRVHVLDGK